MRESIGESTNDRDRRKIARSTRGIPPVYTGSVSLLFVNVTEEDSELRQRIQSAIRDSNVADNDKTRSAYVESPIQGFRVQITLRVNQAPNVLFGNLRAPLGAYRIDIDLVEKTTTALIIRVI